MSMLWDVTSVHPPGEQVVLKRKLFKKTVVELLLKNFSSYSALVPTERQFDIMAFFKSYSFEILERFFPLGNPVVKLATLFRSQIGSSWRLGSTKLTIHILIAAIWLLFFGQEHYNSIWINYSIPTRHGSLIFRYHPHGYNFYPNLYPYGFAVAIGTWVSGSLSISLGDCDDILPWPNSKTIRLKVRNQLGPLNAWSQTIESKELNQPTSADFSTVPTVRCTYFFPHTKLLNETDGYLYNNTMYLEIFLTPQYHLPSLLFFFLFRRDPQSFSTPCQWGELSR